jgi:hypothetical protein
MFQIRIKKSLNKTLTNFELTCLNIQNGQGVFISAGESCLPFYPALHEGKVYRITKMRCAQKPDYTTSADSKKYS